MINFGVVGTGWITDSFIAGAHGTGKWQLSAVYSRRQSTAEEFATKYGITTIHNNLAALGSDVNLHAVYIASPNSLHHEHATVLLKGKKHIILEKPAASNLGELDSLYVLARQNGVFLLEAYRHIQEKNFKVLESAIPRLGPIYGASLNYASYSSRYNKVLQGETPNIFSLEYSGGSLADLAVYPLSTAVALFGAPQNATYKPFIIATGADGGGLLLLEYEKFGVSINASKIYTSTSPSEIYGEKGTLVINGVTDIDRITFVDANGNSKEEFGEQKAEQNLQEEAEEFARIIESKDVEAAHKLELISRAVVSVTEKVRIDNSLVFASEKGSP